MNASAAQQDRVLDGALACVARVGLGKTTLDDVAREAGCARATVYRCFPGKQALFVAVLQRELDALGTRAIAAASATDSLADAVVAVMLTGSETFHSHAALGFVVEHEQEILAPQLSFDRGSAVLRGAAALLAPAFARFVEANRAERLAEWVARLTLSYLLNPSELVRLDDPAQVRAFVVDYVLPGVTESVTAVRGESA
jgi:TetR/AcrR family transcriptional repressor of uid operon